MLLRHYKDPKKTEVIQNVQRGRSRSQGCEQGIMWRDFFFPVNHMWLNLLPTE